MVQSKQVRAASKFTSSSCMHLENIKHKSTNTAQPKRYFASVNFYNNFSFALSAAVVDLSSIKDPMWFV